MVAVKLKVTLPVAVTLPSAGSFKVTVGSVVSGMSMVTVKLAGAKPQLLALSQYCIFQIKTVFKVVLRVKFAVSKVPVTLIL